MSRSYQKNSVGRAHFRLFGAKTLKRDIHKQMRGRIKAMKDKDGIPELPRQIGIGWPLGRQMKSFRYGEDIFYPEGERLPFIGRKLERIRKYDLSKEEVKFIYQQKTK